MAIRTLGQRLQGIRKARQTERALNLHLSDPHLAKDVGLPHRPRPLLLEKLW